MARRKIAADAPPEGATPPPGYSTERGPDGHFLPEQQGVVEGVVFATSVGLIGDAPGLVERLQAAAVEAISECQARGADPDEIRAAILAARDRVLAEDDAARDQRIADWHDEKAKG